MRKLLIGLLLLIGLSGYYTNPCQQPEGTTLESWLSTLEWIPYEAGVFDCTEMSARIEWMAQSCGYDAVIGCDSDHCWVLIEGRAFEPTGNYWVVRNHTSINDYYNPYRVYTSAPPGPEWDWWTIRR